MTVIVVAALSVAVGLLVGNLTDAHVAVFIGQPSLGVAFSAWYVRIKKRIGRIPDGR